ncbi:MAG: hypothetical protein ACYC4D_09115 [Thermoleophilia bacterium]
MSLIIFVVGLLTGLLCLGGFMWSAMEQKPKTIWLLGEGIAILMGMAGLILHSGA